jgi:hypothetical protein
LPFCSPLHLPDNQPILAVFAVTLGHMIELAGENAKEFAARRKR